jgi:hypothetical protein
MKEVCVLRINNVFRNLLPPNIIGRDIGPVTIIKIEKGSSEYQSIKEISKKVKDNYTESFFYGWAVKRTYSKSEIKKANLFHLCISSVFEPAGEECGTLYDESVGCEICGALRIKKSPLIIKRSSVPAKDIAKTIAGEIIVSEKFAKTCKQRSLKGLLLETVVFDKGTSNFFQLFASSKLELSHSTVAGINPFDLSTCNDGEIYKCPEGHTIGLNLLSEPYVLNSQSIGKFDFFASKQNIGVKRGLLRPEPIYFCSLAFREMIEEEKLTGFEFEIANIE